MPSMPCSAIGRLGRMVTVWLDTNRRGHIVPGAILNSLEAPQIDGRHCKARVVEEARDCLDRCPGVPAELRCRVAEDVEPRGREAGCLEVPAEAAVEGPARDLPERRLRVHRREILPDIGKGPADRVVGWSGEFTAATLPAFATVAVEDRLALKAEITRPETHHLGASAAGQDKDQQDRPVSSATHGIGHDSEEPADLVGA